ncbi:MAG: hypothetical protein IKW83_09555 [Muribaculaceae bacterium]|nr:hypothetical protein [Muribaculaceae bacterium]
MLIIEDYNIDFSSNDFELYPIMPCGVGTIEDEENCEDIFDCIGDDIHEEKEDEGKYRLSTDLDNDVEVDLDYVSSENGDIHCTFTFDSQVTFLRFCGFLTKYGFQKMKECNPHHYKVTVFKLTQEDAEFIRAHLLALGNFVPLQSRGEVA